MIRKLVLALALLAVTLAVTAAPASAAFPTPPAGYSYTSVSSPGYPSSWFTISAPPTPQDPTCSYYQAYLPLALTADATHTVVAFEHLTAYPFTVPPGHHECPLPDPKRYVGGPAGFPIF